MPEIAVEPVLKRWEKKLFDLLLAEGRITTEIVEQMRTWQHSRFSVVFGYVPRPARRPRTNSGWNRSTSTRTNSSPACIACA